MSYVIESCVSSYSRRCMCSETTYKNAPCFQHLFVVSCQASYLGHSHAPPDVVVFILSEFVSHSHLVVGDVFTHSTNFVQIILHQLRYTSSVGNSSSRTPSMAKLLYLNLTALTHPYQNFLLSTECPLRSDLKLSMLCITLKSKNLSRSLQSLLLISW